MKAVVRFDIRVACYSMINKVGNVSSLIAVLRPFVKPHRFDKMNRVLRQRITSLHLVMENCANPHNVAAVLRSADAFGIHHCHLIEKYEMMNVESDSSDWFSPCEKRNDAPKRSLSVRSGSSSGASAWLRIHRHSDTLSCLSALRNQGFILCAAALSTQSIPLLALKDYVKTLPVSMSNVGRDAMFTPPMALMFGNENRGLSPLALELADVKFEIPMAGFCDSLNVSVSAAVSMSSLVGACQRSSMRQSETNVLSECGDASLFRGDIDDDEQHWMLLRWLLRDVRSARGIVDRAGLSYLLPPDY